MTLARIAPLDALRGVAALGIVLYHYDIVDKSGALPLSSPLRLIYGYGQLAVPLFYMLSGYIFFAAYARPLGEGRLGGRDFFYLRASRLYPLHLLTLLLAAGLQAMTLRATGDYLGYHHNDLRHFLLSLGFLQFSWFDAIPSFNGPCWSLSIEAALYVVFYVFARRFGAALGARFAFGALCLALSTARGWLPMAGPLNVFFAEGLGCFFVGGCLQATQTWPDRPRLALGLALLALGAALFHLTGGRRETTPALFAGLVVVALASAPLRRVAATRLMAWLGDISYSTYLWHLPVQLTLTIVSATFAPIDFTQPYALALYVAATLTVSTLSHRYFEVPARGLVRRWAGARGKAAIVVGA